MELPKHTYENQLERIGVHSVGLALTKLGLIFRETSNTDTGIDGQIEYVDNEGYATGKIVAVQIKSGDSYLHDSKTDANNWIFYPEIKHKYYWENFSIPIILFVYSPSRDKIYFVDVRQYIKINGFGNVKIPKANTLNTTAKNIFFECDSNDKSVLEIANVFNTMVQNKNKSPLFNLSYLDLYLQGLTNMCSQIYFDMSIAMDIVECRSLYISGGSEEYDFLYDYVKFLVNQNLAEIDFDNCMVEWEHKKIVPRFLAALTHRGKVLLEYINNIEKKYSAIMPENPLVQERLMQLLFDNYSFLRIEKAQKIQEQYRIDLTNKDS